MLVTGLLLAQVTIIFNEEFDKNEVCSAADTSIDGYHFDVTLFRNHSMLAEYRKVLKVKQAEKPIFEKEFIDTGGLATFYFLKQDNRILVLDGIRNGFVLDLRSREISDIDLATVPDKYWEKTFGQFKFVHEGKRVYRWVPTVEK